MDPSFYMIYSPLQKGLKKHVWKGNLIFSYAFISSLKKSNFFECIIQFFSKSHMHWIRIIFLIVIKLKYNVYLTHFSYIAHIQDIWKGNLPKDLWTTFSKVAMKRQRHSFYLDFLLCLKHDLIVCTCLWNSSLCGGHHRDMIPFYTLGHLHFVK